MHGMVKSVFLERLSHVVDGQTAGVDNGGSIVSDMIKTLSTKSYGLYIYVHVAPYILDGSFPSKTVWKDIVLNSNIHIYVDENRKRVIIEDGVERLPEFKN